MPYSSLLGTYLGSGTFAAIPVAATIAATVPPGWVALYYATDNSTLYGVANGEVAWTSFAGGAAPAISVSTAVSTVDSNQNTSLSQISSSLSGAISSTASLSTAVSTVISGSISTVTSSVTSLSTAIGALGALHVYEEQASGTAGGATTATKWHHRILNTTALNTITGATRVTFNFTVTIASPGVVTSVAHGLIADSAVILSTTGALPTGLAVATVYYVVSPAADTFNLALTPGGAAINTSGSQSGTHSAVTSAVTLLAGTYDVFAQAPTYDDASYSGKIRLWNMTDNAVILPGSTFFQGTMNFEQRGIVQGRFVLSGTKNICVMSYTSTSQATNGLGVNAGIAAEANHLTDMFISRVA